MCAYLPGILIAERTHVHAQREGVGAGVEIDISEERGLEISPQTWSESLWLVTIVMTTVGFGDFAPVSFVGRFFTLAAALVGILLSALMISIVQNQLTLSFQQGYAVKCLIRDRLQEKLEQCAATLIKTHWLMYRQAHWLHKMQQARADERHSQGDLTSWARERAMAWRKRARTDAHPLPEARVVAAVSPYLAISRPISRTLGETASVLKRVRRFSRERTGEMGRDLAARYSERGSARAESSSVGEKGGRLVSFPGEGQAGDGMPSAPPSPPSLPQHTRVAAITDDDDDNCDDVDADASVRASASDVDVVDDDRDDAVVNDAVVNYAVVVVSASSATLATPRTGAATHDLEGGAEGGTPGGGVEGMCTSSAEVLREAPPMPAVPRHKATVSVEREDSPTSRHGKGSSRDSARRCASFAHGCFSSVAVAGRRSNAATQSLGHSASAKGRASAAASADALRKSSRAFTRPSTSISASSSGSPEIGDEPL